MVSKKIEKLLNDQIAKEQYAAHYYLSMSAYFEGKDLEGLAHYFRLQSKEELGHADKMFDFLYDAGGEVKIQAIPEPPSDFKDPEDVFAKALAEEKENTQNIFKISKAADDENDYATKTFLQWYVNEQVEEESNASLNLNKMRMVKNDPSALYLFDQELGKRTSAE